MEKETRPPNQGIRIVHTAMRPAHDTRIALLSVADLTGFVDFFVRKTRVSGRCFPDLLFGKIGTSAKCVTTLGDLSALLSRVVLIGQPALRLRCDIECTGSHFRAG